MTNTNSKNESLLDEVQEHLEESDKFMETIRGDFDDLEAMLVASLTDSLSAKSENKIFDPILSSIVYERTSRVMAQSPKGKAYAQSTDDVGKNALMNLLLKYFYKNANEQDTMLVKLRLWELYSLVYGSMFAIVPWRVKGTGYIGPEFNLLPIRDCFPQPTRSSVDDMDFFTVRSVVTIDWLKKQDPETWDMGNIELLEKQLKEEKSGGDTSGNEDDKKKSYVEKTFYPTTYSDAVFPQVEIYSEYRKTKWITWSPRRINVKTSQPFILRETGSDDKPAYPNEMLPIVAKHAFPLIDAPVGFGEFARGKSLQMGINSLWNLYLQGVRYSIFPPLHINAEGVVPSSIKWKEGEFWFMDHPNQDVQAMQMRPSGIETFNSTYGAMKSAIESQAGTSSISESTHVKTSLGKTPQAIEYMSQREGARDEWDRVMMEQSITKVYERWIALTVTKMEKEVQVRLFGDEIEDIQKTYPDVVEMFESGRGVAKVKKDMIDSTYDFVLETGSTKAVNLEEEQSNITDVLKAALENPQLLEVLRAEGKTINFAELFKRWVSTKVRDTDKIVTDLKPETTQEVEGQGIPPQEEQMQQMPQQDVVPMPQQVGGQQPQISPEDFRDPEIQRAFVEMMQRNG